MGTEGNAKVVRLTAERLRRLEQRMAAIEEAQRGTNTRLDQTNARLDQAIDVLTRLVGVVAAQNDRINRNFSQLNDRIDRLAGRFDHLAKAIKIAKPHVEYYWQNLIHEINTAALHKMMAQNPDVDWNRVKPPFDYGAAAPTYPPLWQSFLRQLWPGDEDGT